MQKQVTSAREKSWQSAVAKSGSMTLSNRKQPKKCCEANSVEARGIFSAADEAIELQQVFIRMLIVTSRQAGRSDVGVSGQTRLDRDTSEFHVMTH